MSASAGWRDISLAVSAATPEWPGDTPFSCGWTMRINLGSSVNLSAITMSPHVGTHADAPLHVHDGWPASEALPLHPFIGRARVCTVEEGVAPLDAVSLRSLPRTGPIERLLVRTGRGIANGSFPESWPALSLDALAMLLERGLLLLGVDAPSVDARESKSLEVHRALFGGGAFNLENLDLREVPDGEYDLYAFPMRICGVDAAPVRALLRDRESR